MHVIERAIIPDGVKIQLEDWHENNTKEYPDLHGYTIAAYPYAKNTGKYGIIRSGEIFRISVSMNKYANYTDDMVLVDYEALKNGTKTLADLRKRFWNGERDEFYLGLIDEEPERC